MEAGRAGRRAKGASKPGSKGEWNARRPPVNTGDPVPGLFSAECRVREIQAKLHRWARDDPHRRFNDLFNLVADPAFLLAPGIGCGATRELRPLGWTAALRRLSRWARVSRSSSTSCGPHSETAVSRRCRYGSG